MDIDQAAAVASFIKDYLSLEQKTRTPSILSLTKRKISVKLFLFTSYSQDSRAYELATLLCNFVSLLRIERRSQPPEGCALSVKL